MSRPNALNVKVLEESFALLEPKLDRVVDDFYLTLFRQSPAAKPLFAGVDMAGQKKHLAAGLRLIAANLRNPGTLGKALASMGRRHAEYGAKPEHYPLVGKVLLTVLKKHAGPAWTPAVSNAWSAAYQTIADAMIAAYPKPHTENSSKEKSMKKPASSQADWFAHFPQAAFVVDAAGCITRWNSEAETLTGLTSAEVLGKKTAMALGGKRGMTLVDQALASGEAQSGSLSIGQGTDESKVMAKTTPMLSNNGQVTGAVVSLEGESRGSSEAAQMKSAVENSATAVMMVDRDLKITFANKATLDMVSKNLDTFKKTYPGFSLENLIGSNIDFFHQNPAHQRKLLADPRNLPHQAEIKVGDLTFALNISAQIDEKGAYVGNTLEWNDVSGLIASRLRNKQYEAMNDAIDKSQATIEFKMDGTILTANENFCTTLGYSLSEIVGKHHRMFVDPSEAQSQKYQAFWERLNRGEFEAGEYKRIAKNGREVWIQASYNPILDMSGKPFKVVKYASDITASKLQTADFEGQLAAIGKSQAVISFKMDGTILDANENFCSAVGYAKSEIVGKHHRIFVEPAEAQSPGYQAFWERLNRGEFDAGEYKRIGKGNKEIWIQASYNPILDMSGKPFKVVKYASDITQAKLEGFEKEKASKVFSDAVQILIEAGEAGNLSARGDLEILDSTWRPIMQGINGIIDSIVAPIDELKEKLGRIAGGDLTAYVTGDYKGDHQLLKNALNDTLESLNDILGQVATAADQVASGARQVSDSSQALSQGATEQASSLEEITASMTEMSGQTKQNAENASQANQLAASARSGAESGNELMQQMVKAMGEIDDSSQNISKIIKAIDEIAFQTNLLALNAAVEAARAGVHGKGFAVVAEEVRNLAARSAKAAKETTEMIEGSIKKVNQGSEIARKTAESLESIVSGVGKVTDLVAEIAAASNEQAQGIAQVNQGLTQLDQVTQQNTSSAEESAAASEELSSQSSQLKQLLGKFVLKAASEAGMPQGLPPEMMAAIQQYLAAQGMGGAPRPKGDWTPSGSARPSETNHRPSAPRSKPVISLDDADFGRF